MDHDNKFCTDIHASQRMNPIDSPDVSSSATIRLHFCLLVKCLYNYWMHCHENRGIHVLVKLLICLILDNQMLAIHTEFLSALALVIISKCYHARTLN